MKKILFILSFILMLFTTASASIIMDITDEEIENVSVIKLSLPGVIRVFPGVDSTFVKINGNDSIVLKNIIYEIKDSVMNIKLKRGTYHDWNIQDNDLCFLVGLPNDNPKIIPSNDLILSRAKTKNKSAKSNHDNN